MQDAASHWDDVYGSKPLESVSWFETRPETSLRLLALASPERGAVVDVGAGASFLADALLDAGWSDVTVLDVSSEALDLVRARLTGRDVSYVVTDLLAWQPERGYDAWHDRAVFHFLTEEDEREDYRASLERHVPPGGWVVVATFGPDGPTTCSGLPIVRYSHEALAAEFPGYELVDTGGDDHETPWGTVQQFTAVLLRRPA